MTGSLFALALAGAATGAAPPRCSPGVYLERAEGPVAIEQLQTDRRRAGGSVGLLLFGGMRIKTAFEGNAPALRTSSRQPSFIFCLPEPPAPPSGGIAYVGLTARQLDPRLFRLVRFDVKKGRREAVLSEESMFGPRSGSILAATFRVQQDEVAPDVFRVRPVAPLPRGEYGFLRTATVGTDRKGRPEAREIAYAFAVE